MSHIEDLRWAAEIAKESITEADPDKRSGLLGQYRAILAEIAEIEGEESPAGEGKVNGLVLLQEELAKRRQSGASGTRRPGARGL